MGKSGGGDAKYYREQEQARQERIRKGTKSINETFGQFDDTFYDGQKQAYLDYAMPQLEDQRGEAAKDLTFALARSGQLEGSARADLAAQLQKQYDLQAQNVADQALDYRTKAQTNVENARTDLVSTLNATGDAQNAANSAIARASALSQPAAFNPLTSLFADFTGALGTATAAERARQYGWGTNGGTYGASLYGNSGKSVQVQG